MLDEIVLSAMPFAIALAVWAVTEDDPLPRRRLRDTVIAFAVTAAISTILYIKVYST